MGVEFINLGIYWTNGASINHRIDTLSTINGNSIIFMKLSLTLNKDVTMQQLTFTVIAANNYVSFFGM